MSLVSLSLFVHSAPRAGDGTVSAPCEDERMILVPDETRAMIAVLDGCGGTGARKYPLAQNWTGARIASTLVSRELYRWFSSFPEEAFSSASAEALAEDLAARLKESLISAREILEGSSAPAFISSRMSKSLPTTLAVMTAETLPDERIRLRSFWAGNSRNYILSPSGLLQFSWDDLVGNYDPFEDLNKDGILSNSVNASSPFVIHAAEKLLCGPCMIFSASDGVFSYFDSPIRLEWILLDSLSRAASPADWEASLQEEIGAVSADDHTLQLAVLGFESFSALQEAYRPRRAQMEREYLNDLDAVSENGDAEQLRTLWERYKPSYLSAILEEVSDHG